MSATEGDPRHTDPRSFAVRAIMAMRNAVFPMVAILFAMRDEGYGIFLALGVGLLIAAIAAVSNYLAWTRFTYRVGTEDIRVEQGILSRAARSVPYERIQDVSLEQALVPRLFGLVEVKFETGSGGGEDLKLSYLTETEGEALRELVRERREEEAAPAAEKQAGEEVIAAADPPAKLLFAMDMNRLIIFSLFQFSLAAVAVVGGLTQQFDFLLPFDIWDLDFWRDELAEQGESIAGLGQQAQFVGAMLGVIALVALGFATGLVRTFLRDWGFLLEKTARGFRRRRGLLTRTDVVMPTHRVQAVKIGTGLLRYRFGWHGLNFVSLAQDAGSSNHVVAPFAKMAEIAPIMAEAGFAMPAPDASWHRASKNYRTDSILLESAIPLFATVPVAIFAPLPFVIIPLSLAILAAVANYYSWRFRRHALDARQVISVHGLLSPETQIASRVKLHSVEIAQGPIAQHRGYATVNLGLAGGSFTMHGVPIRHARALRAAVLDSISASDFSQINAAVSGAQV